MVDMSSADLAQQPRTPEDEEQDDALEQQSKYSNQMVAAGFCMALSAALVGLGYQWGQWWLLAAALVALGLLTGVYNESRGRLSRARERLERASRAGTILVASGALGKRRG